MLAQLCDFSCNFCEKWMVSRVINYSSKLTIFFYISVMYTISFFCEILY